MRDERARSPSDLSECPTEQICSRLDLTINADLDGSEKECDVSWLPWHPDVVSVAVALAVHRLADTAQRTDAQLNPASAEYTCQELREILQFVMRIKRALDFSTPVMIGTLMYAQLFIRVTGYDWHHALLLGANFAGKVLFEETMYLGDMLLVTEQYSLGELHLMEKRAMLDLLDQLHYVPDEQLHVFRMGLLTVLEQEPTVAHELLGRAPDAGLDSSASAFHVLVVDAEESERESLAALVHAVAPQCVVTACAGLADVRRVVREPGARPPALVLFEPHLGDGEPASVAEPPSVAEALVAEPTSLPGGLAMGGFAVVDEVLARPVFMNEGRPIFAAVTRCADMHALVPPSSDLRPGVDVAFHSKPLSIPDLKFMLAFCW